MLRLPVRAANLALMVGLLAAGSAVADYKVPNGNPTGPDTAYSPVAKLAVGLIPNPSIYMPDASCPWLLPAAQSATQPYNKSATDTWVFKAAPVVVNGNALKGSLTLTDYEAWADNSPTLTLGANTFTYGAQPGRGGAGFSVNYTMGAGDPDPANVKWIQVIDSNQPTQRGIDYGVKLPDGTTIYMDNSTGADPYYGRLSGYKSANGTGFADLTNFDLASSNGIRWLAQAFMTTESNVTDPMSGVITHTVTIYDGVYWGFTVPEPSTYFQLLSGGVIVLVFSHRRRVLSRRQAA